MAGKDAVAPMLDGGGRIRLRAPSSQSISPEQIEIFLTTLADTCNVARSAKAAGFATQSAYRKRKTDAGFRGEWAKAVAEAYAKLELVLLERAMKGTIKRVQKPGGGERRIREYSNTLAIALLRRHGESIDFMEAMSSPEEAEEARERILEKLARLRERNEREDAEDDGGSTAGQS